MVGSQVRDSEIRWSRLKASLFHLSWIGAFTLSNKVTPRKASGPMTVYAGWSGSFMVSACVWSVGSGVKNVDILLTITSLTQHCIGQRRWWSRCGGKRLFCSVGKLSCYLFCQFCHVLPFLYGAEHSCNLNGTILPIHLYLNGVSLIPFISDFSWWSCY